MGGRAGGGARGGGGAGFNGMKERVSGQVQLQGVGKVDAIAAKDIQLGDTLMWNYGYTSKVTAIERTPKGRKITTKASDGKFYTNQYGNNRLIGVKTF